MLRPLKNTIPHFTYFFRRAADRITSFYADLMGAECKPLTMGGDHFVTYPILRAIAEKHGPVRSNGSRVYLYHLPLEAKPTTRNLLYGKQMVDLVDS